jgi:RNA polymerase sigma-70 factor (ECF subfamily)
MSARSDAKGAPDDQSAGHAEGKAMHVRSDAELLRDAEDDPAAFRGLYDRYAGPIHGFCLKRTGDHDAALDLTAETFAQAWESRHRFSDQRDGSLGPWLFGIARNVLLRSVRSQRMIDAARVQLQIEHERLAVEPDEGWIEGLDADLEAAVTALKPEQRRAIQLRVLDDRSYEDVADELGCSPVAARIRVSRGLSTIRSLLMPNNSKEASA